jgi:hypothetical protein
MGELEFTRQVLEEVGERGLSGRELSELVDKPFSTIVNSFVTQLTYYCGIYEENRRGTNFYVLDPEIDEIMGRSGARKLYLGGNGKIYTNDDEEDYEDAGDC